MKTDRAAVASEISNVLANYDIGKLVDFERNERGYVNTSYAIKTIRAGVIKKFFLRRYRPGIQQEELTFEHAVISHALDRNFALVAKVFKTKQGTTYCIKYPQANRNQPVFYAIFEFLPGEDKYTWIDPRCSLRELKNSAAVLAQFHHVVADLIPNGRKFEPKILDFLPQVVANLNSSRKFSKGTVFDAYLGEYLSLLVDSFEAFQQSLASSVVSNGLQIVIHNDFHPGNLKFFQEQVVGLFDFDGSKIDLRCFDVALALWYFFTSWKGEEDGKMRIDECKNFLETYQLTLQGMSHLNPLNQVELLYLPMMINAANLYILNWTVTDYHAKDVDPEEYLIYLQHNVNFARWFFDSGKESLQKTLGSA